MPCEGKTGSGSDVYLGLGSNLNNPSHQIKQAIKWLQRSPQTQVIACASWYQSKAWGVTEQDDFINTVVHAKTKLSPLALLRRLKVIEYRLMQRQANARWHARCIDIDILLYDRQRHRHRELCVPHPLMAERCFVAAPLLELNPHLPAGLNHRIRTLLSSGVCTKELQKLPPSQRRHGLKGTVLL